MHTASKLLSLVVVAHVAVMIPSVDATPIGGEAIQARVRSKSPTTIAQPPLVTLFTDPAQCQVFAMSVGVQTRTRCDKSVSVGAV